MDMKSTIEWAVPVRALGEFEECISILRANADLMHAVDFTFGKSEANTEIISAAIRSVAYTLTNIVATMDNIVSNTKEFPCIPVDAKEIVHGRTVED